MKRTFLRLPLPRCVPGSDAPHLAPVAVGVHTTGAYACRATLPSPGVPPQLLYAFIAGRRNYLPTYRYLPSLPPAAACSYRCHTYLPTLLHTSPFPSASASACCLPTMRRNACARLRNVAPAPAATANCRLGDAKRISSLALRMPAFTAPHTHTHFTPHTCTHTHTTHAHLPCTYGWIHFTTHRFPLLPVVDLLLDQSGLV